MHLGLYLHVFQPVRKDHLPYKTIVCWLMGWSYKAGSTVFLYGCETWGQIPKQEYSDLQKVNKTFLKYIQGLKNRTHY